MADEREIEYHEFALCRENGSAGDLFVEKMGSYEVRRITCDECSKLYHYIIDNVPVSLLTFDFSKAALVSIFGSRTEIQRTKSKLEKETSLILKEEFQSDG